MARDLMISAPMNPKEDEETRSHLFSATGHATGSRLIAIWDGGAASIPLPRSGEVLIGRSKSCNLRIDDASVSREHALLKIGPGLSISDLGSSNGVIVDDEKLTRGATVSLSLGNTVQLGAALLIVQHFADAPVEPSQIRYREEHELSASSLEMLRLHRLADLVATGSLSVIIFGETGAGKEVLAGRIHAHSKRANQPFLRINCASFAESMIESELFGHERGAFTGAVQAKAGLLESASGGTLLLDEVGELPPATQAKLLRAVGNGEVLRIGSNRPRAVDVRFIAATHRDLRQLVAQGRFREDLFFRLNGITLSVPPLRDRRDEILSLAEEFLRRDSEYRKAAVPSLAASAREVLLAHSWPGNIRELKSAVERAALLCAGGVIEVTDLALEGAGVGRSAELRGPSSLDLAAPVAPGPMRSEMDSDSRQSRGLLKAEMQNLERVRIVDALSRCGGNQSQAAKLLGISRRALLHRLDAYELPRPRKGRLA